MVKTPLEIRTLQLQEMESLLERARARLDANDCQLLQRLIQTVQQLWQLVEQQDMSMGRLRHLLLGPHTEKTDRVLPESADLNAAASNQPEEAIGGRQRRRGHGRHGASDYSGAQKIKVAHPKLRAGDACPDCAQGKLYGLTQPSPILRIVAQPIFPASVYQLEKLRCNLCGQLFTAPPPPEAGTQKYDESVGSMLALLRYGSGLPFARIEKLQAGFGVPLPTTTQWELVESVEGSVLDFSRGQFRGVIEGSVLDFGNFDPLRLPPRRRIGMFHYQELTRLLSRTDPFRPVYGLDARIPLRTEQPALRSSSMTQTKSSANHTAAGPLPACPSRTVTTRYSGAPPSPP